MNLSDIRSRVRLLAPEATTGVIDNMNMNSLINDAALDVVYRTNCLQNYADKTVVAATQEYDVPTDCLKVLAVYYGGTGEWEKLPEVTMTWLSNQVDDDWFDDTGTTYAYYKRAAKIGLYKTPTSSEAGTNYLRIFYIEQPDTVSSDSDVPFNSITNLYHLHELIYLHVMSKIKQMRGKWDEAKLIEADYLSKCEKAKVECAKLDDFQQPIRPYHRGGGGSGLKENPLDQ